MLKKKYDHGYLYLTIIRWLSVYIYDMEILHETNPTVFEEFKHQGNFLISRARNVFSAMGLDQQHEQLNKDVKGDGGIVGLTEDEDKLRHWSICSPEVSRVVSEFEKNTVLEPKIHTKFHHHEEVLRPGLRSICQI